HGIDKTVFLHVAESLFHDHLPANRHDLANCRIFRRRNQKGQGASAGSGVKDIPVFDVSVGSMSELVELHRFQSEK
ncbi:MAG: haloacid dehalogenase, partial [Albidovulum sp.]|nr:haloacid dehalogenase [Albidovulum sp.]